VGYAAGVDTHKEQHYIAVLNELGEVVDRFSIKAKADGYEEAIDKTKGYVDLSWGIEGTGTYGRAFADALIAIGAIVYEVPGFVTKRHRRKLRRPGKSDPQDAQAIAEAVLRERDTLSRCERSDEQEATRLLFDRRDRLVRSRTECVNRLRSLALRLDVELAGNLTSRKSMEALEVRLASFSAQGYAQFELLDEARETVREIHRLLSKISELEKRLVPFVERSAATLLEVHGISTIVAAGFLGHIGIMGNIRSADAFAMRAGVAPIPCSSGKHQAMRLNTGGNRQLNRLLHIVALSQTRKDGHPGAIYYKRKRTEGHTHREALRALKRRLATVVYYRLKVAMTPPASTLLKKAA
jgi:transposase